MKDIGGKLTAMGKAFSSMFADDEVMIGSLASYTFENLEIGSYSIIIAAAEALGETELAAIAKENLAEEEAIALWLKEQAPELARLFLARADCDSDAAKR